MKPITALIQDFLFHCRFEKNLAEKTLTAYHNDLRQFTQYLVDDTEISSAKQIDKHILRAYLQYITGIAKPKTVKRKFATLKTFFHFLELEDLILVSPFRKMRVKITLEDRLPTVMTLPEVKRLFTHLYTNLAALGPQATPRRRMLLRDIAVLEMLFATGMRVAELAGLRVGHVDLESGTVRIFGKGRKERILPLCDAQVLHSLVCYRDELDVEGTGDDPFFLTRSGKSISEQTVRLLVEKHTRSAGIDKKITPHTFRHTVATLLLENGVDIRNIQNILGHSNITTTEIYTKINSGSQRELLRMKHPRRLF